jgi:hypothetical protein
MSESSLRKLSATPAYKQIVVDFKAYKERNALDLEEVLAAEQSALDAEDIAFSNQTTFETKSFGTVNLKTLWALAMSDFNLKKDWVDSASGVTVKATPTLNAEKAELEAILERIIAGKKLQGINWGKGGRAHFRNTFEPKA